MRWRNLKLRIKLMVVFGACFIIFMTFTLWNSYTIEETEKAQKELMHDQQESIALLDDISAQITEVAFSVLNKQVNGNDYASMNSQIYIRTNYSDSLSFRNENLSKRFIKTINNIDETLSTINFNLVKMNVQMNSFGQSGYGAENNITKIVNDLNFVGDEVAMLRSASNELIESELDIINNAKNKQDRIRNIAISSTVLILIILFLFLVISIENSTRRTVRISKQLSKGNLNNKIGNTNNDEFGIIERAMAALQERLREIFENINETIGDVKSASSELSVGSQLISDGANNQAATSSSISTAIDQIAMISRTTTDTANETNEIARIALKGILQGASDVNVAYKTIKEIAEKNSVISDISYQTKILSINASVEAARAAEYGRGFSVIAEQVKRLAENSQESAADIKDVSKKGVAITRESSEKLMGLVEEFRRTSELIASVAESGTEQYTSIQQISHSIQALNTVTQQNASSSEELAASSVEMVRLSETLTKQISYFKLYDSDETENESKSNEESENVVSNIDDNEFHQTKEDEKEIKDSEFSHEKEQVIEPVVENESIPEPIKSVEKEEIKVENKKLDSVEIKTKGVKINLTDNDGIDNQFKKIK